MSSIHICLGIKSWSDVGARYFDSRQLFEHSNRYFTRLWKGVTPRSPLEDSESERENTV